MNISLDYDDTFTKDPDGWLAFIKLMQSRGHCVMCVTMRHESEGQEVMQHLGHLVMVYFTNRKAKQSYMYSRGIHIDVFIDDCPAWCIQDADNPVEESKIDEESHNV